MPQRPKRLTPSRGPLDLFGSEVRRYRELAGRFADIATYALPAELSAALIREIADEVWKP